MRLRNTRFGLLFAGLLTLGFASVGRADLPPWPYPHSSVPGSIRLVGRDALGTSDPSGDFTVTIRDLANNPGANIVIRVEFLPCAAASICPTQGPAVTAVNCTAPNPWVEGISASDGTWSTAIVGCTLGGQQASLNGCVRIYANGELVGSPRVSIVDLSGCDGVGANDLSVWLTDFASELGPERSDYDGEGYVGANDLSLWLTTFGSTRSALNCGSVACP